MSEGNHFGHHSSLSGAFFTILTAIQRCAEGLGLEKSTESVLRKVPARNRVPARKVSKQVLRALRLALCKSIAQETGPALLFSALPPHPGACRHFPKHFFGTLPSQGFVLKKVLRRFGTRRRFSTDLGKRYGEGSEMLVFVGEKRQGKRYRKWKNYGRSTTCRERRTIFSTEGSFGFGTSLDGRQDCNAR